MYNLVYGILYLISLLPLRVLYLLSDLAYFLVYRVFGYRKQVVMANLRQAFPEKEERELKIIASRFYRNFTDNFIEVIKLFTASPAYIQKHFKGDYSLCNEVFASGRRCELLLAHNFNWEWACLAIPLSIRHDFLVVYMPLTNKTFDRIFMKLRARTGSLLLPATDMRTAMLKYRNNQYMLALVADQNAGSPAHAHWFRFFGKPAPFVRGPENGARSGDIPVLFCRFVKERRGYYRIEFEMGEEHPAQLAEGELTRKFVRYLEYVIREQPDNWLWSHRRWKHEWKEAYGPVREL